MRVARAYFRDKDIVTVSLGQDIEALNTVKFSDDITKLKKSLSKENEDVIGISDFRIGNIKYYANGTYGGIIYSSVRPFKGEWTEV